MLNRHQSNAALNKHNIIPARRPFSASHCDLDDLESPESEPPRADQSRERDSHSSQAIGLATGHRPPPTHQPRLRVRHGGSEMGGGGGGWLAGSGTLNTGPQEEEKLPPLGTNPRQYSELQTGHYLNFFFFYLEEIPIRSENLIV